MFKTLVSCAGHGQAKHLFLGVIPGVGGACGVRLCLFSSAAVAAAAAGRNVPSRALAATLQQTTNGGAQTTSSCLERTLRPTALSANNGASNAHSRALSSTAANNASTSASASNKQASGFPGKQAAAWSAGVLAAATAAAATTTVATCNEHNKYDYIERSFNFAYELRLRQSSDITRTFEYFATYMDDDGLVNATAVDVARALIPVWASSEARPGERMGSRQGELEDKNLKECLENGKIRRFHKMPSGGKVPDTNNAIFRLVGQDPNNSVTPLFTFEDFECLVMLMSVPESILHVFAKLLQDGDNKDELDTEKTKEVVLMMRERAGLHCTDMKGTVWDRFLKSGVTAEREHRKDPRLFRQTDINGNAQNVDSSVERLMALLRRECAAEDAKPKWYRLGSHLASLRSSEATNGMNATPSVSISKIQRFIEDLRHELIWALWLHYDRDGDGALRADNFAFCISAAARIDDVSKVSERLQQLPNRVKNWEAMSFDFVDLFNFMEFRRKIVCRFRESLELLEVRDRALKSAAEQSRWEAPERMERVIDNLYDLKVRKEVFELLYGIFCGNNESPSRSEIRQMMNVINRRVLVSSWTSSNYSESSS